jgi:phage terminase large subunit
MAVKHGSTLAGTLASASRAWLAANAPPETDADRCKRYANDPVGFARDVLRIWPWSRQRQILEAVLKHKRVSVVSGHKVAKSTSYAILALWFYCSFPGARVVITATTDRQVNGIIWREIKRLLRHAAIKIPGVDTMGIRAFTGITDPSDFSEIRGYTAKEAEAIAGISGEYVLYLVDEASGVKDFIFEAIEGNRAAGTAWALLASNPTKADGEFFDSHHAKRRSVAGESGYEAIHIDSRESPNVTGEWREMQEWDAKAGCWQPRTRPVPGLAGPGWIEEKRREWGEGDPRFKVRIAGLFCVAEEAKIFPLALIEEMQAAWDDAESTGRLYIGVDPSGDGDGGDEGGFCARRGSKVIELRAQSGLPPAAYCAIIDDLIGAHADPSEPQPAVLVESEGEAGWRVYTAIREHQASKKHFELIRVRTSDKALRQRAIYDRLRDELWANARAWARAGGAIPRHSKLEDDLHAPEFRSNDRGLLKVTPKKDLKVLLGRSPDVGDAFVISCWEPMRLRAEDRGDNREEARQVSEPHDMPDVTYDPYAAADAFI